MDNRNIVVYTFILLFLVLSFSNFFAITGFLSKDQRLIVSLDIPSDQQKINPGQSLLLEVKIREPGGNLEETSIINLEYAIKDLKGNVISSKKESGVIAVKQSDVTSLLIPTNTKHGVYTASVNVEYGENIYSGSKTFEVVTDKKFSSNIIVYILIALISLVFVIFIVKILKDKKSHRKNKNHKRRRK